MGATAVLHLVLVAVSGSIALLADTVHNVGHAGPSTSRVCSSRWCIALSAGVIIWEYVNALVNPYQSVRADEPVVGRRGRARRSADNELVAVYRIRTGLRIGSAALVAEGQPARADGPTSIAVVLGVVGVLVGFAQPM